MTMQTADYRAILRDELLARSRRNPGYSLRAFAKDLQMSPSRLSEVLSGKHGLSRMRAKNVAAKLGLKGDHADYFCSLVDVQHPRSKILREAAKERLREIHADKAYTEVGLDAFQLIAGWHHFAILELLSIRGTSSKMGSIATCLDLNEKEVTDAVERLLRVGLLEWRGKELVPRDSDNATTSGVPSEAIRKCHEELLQKALTALFCQTVDERDFGAMIMKVNPQKMTEAKEFLRSMRREFDRKFNDADEAKDVYCFATQFFRLTKPSPTNGVPCDD